jgi:hypothetical protein
MSRKYIKQYLDQNFVFPNNDVYEYDTEIVHDINNNSVSGTVLNLTATTVTASSIVLTYDWTWAQNGAEIWINPDGTQQLISVHILAPGQDYFKPWRLVDVVSTGTTGNTTYSGSDTVTIQPGYLGLTYLPSGQYFIEFRFIGHRAIYPACGSLTLVVATPTPTPTLTLTPTITPTRTPDITTTPTPTPTQTMTPTPGAYTLYLADRYTCLYPGCSFDEADVVVALPTSHTPQYGKFYPADTPDGYAYNLITTTGAGPGLILNVANFTACADACIV